MAGPVTTITLFVEDLAGATEFYGRAFGLDVYFEDDDSAVFGADRAGHIWEIAA